MTLLNLFWDLPKSSYMWTLVVWHEVAVFIRFPVVCGFQAVPSPRTPPINQAAISRCNNPCNTRKNSSPSHSHTQPTQATQSKTQLKYNLQLTIPTHNNQSLPIHLVHTDRTIHRAPLQWSSSFLAPPFTEKTIYGLLGPIKGGAAPLDDEMIGWHCFFSGRGNSQNRKGCIP